MSPRFQRATPAGTPDELAEVVRAGLADLPVAAGTSTLAFTTNVLRFVQEWLDHRTGQNLTDSADSVFVLSDRPRVDGEERGFARVHYLAQDPRRDVCGNLIVCAANVQDAYVHAHAAQSMHDAVCAAIDARLGDRPAVIFSPALGKLTLCPRGVENHDASCSLLVAVNDVDVTQDSVDEFLTQFHAIYLRAPQRYKRFWADAAKYVPVPHAEQEVQFCLVPMAMARFSRSIVRFEEEMVEGRADVTITPDPQGSARGSAVLELKALRSRYPAAKGKTPRSCSDAENDRSVVDGIDQANVYRNERRCEHAFVCCYDFRENDDATYLDRFREVADERRVVPRRYPVYNEAAASRRSRPDSAYRAAKKAGIIKK
jgi:hypothetical protein